MNIQNLIVYQFNTLYEILNELEENLNFDVLDTNSEKSLKSKINISKKYVIVTKKRILNLDNQIVLDKFPIKLNKFIEKLNIQFLKQQFNHQSKYKVKDYSIDLNSRYIYSKNKKLKLTEKEISTILYLTKISKTISIKELQNKVWGYQSDLETHTVETHVYRLRKKFLTEFNDENFILSDNNGYKIK
ncbi:winged helix-turn-helix domain-containing protein [Candidatus Pelagibacter sp.]|nr:winged helix-turn-helix domain-containing protein [Candidatus Pelagibacter sp.]